MTPLWHDGAIDSLAPGDHPVVWSIDAGSAVATRMAAVATPDDRADAAHATDDGGWRLLRRQLARALIARRAGLPAASVRLGRSPAGAPLVVAPLGWHLSASSSQGDTLIGVARRPIAVDREPIDDADPLDDMLAPAERRAIDRLPAADRPLDWLRRWTIKEAHAKLIGQPLRIRPETIETQLENDRDAVATFEGRSRCWTRRTTTALETVAMWA